MNKLYFVKNNAYNMCISDDGEIRRVISNECVPQGTVTESEAIDWLNSVEDDSSWERYEETVEELTAFPETEIIAEIECTDSDVNEKIKISDMNRAQLRCFLRIDSISDSDIATFDEWDNAHPGRDTFTANARRKQLIEQLIANSFVAAVDDVAYIINSIQDDDDRTAIAQELVNIDTYLPLWETIADNFSVPEAYTGIDAFVEAAQLEFAANVKGDYAAEDDISFCFASNGEKIKLARTKKNLSRPDIFNSIGIPVRTLEDWEGGKRQPSDWETKLIINKINSL